MNRSSPYTQKIEALAWWSALFVIILIASWLRLNHLWDDLPTNKDPDEPYYYLWARAIRETGRPDAENGTGYPPAVLYLLAGEQTVIDVLEGDAVKPSVDHFGMARSMMGLFGVLCVPLSAWLGKRIARSPLVGVASALMTAMWPLIVSESRSAGASAPWLFFTLLTFVLLLKARDKDSLSYLDLAFVSGIVSFLFKYQSVVILALPPIYAWVYFRRRSQDMWLHLVVWITALALLFAWLLLDYRILEVVNTPYSPTRTAVSEGRLIGFQSLEENRNILLNAVGGKWYLWGAGLALIFAVGTFFAKRTAAWIDSGLVLSLVVFDVFFFLLMSLFAAYPRFHLYWLPVTSSIHTLAMAGLFVSLRLLSTLFALWPDPNRAGMWKHIPSLALATFGLFLAREQWRDLDWAYHHEWTKPYSLKSLDEWFDANVPQGGRAISEAVKMPYNYVDSPSIVHVNVVGSISDEPIMNYRSRGYEYLIWNSMRSNPTDALPDLDVRRQSLIDEGAQEVLRLAGEEFWGPEIVLFQLRPIQQHVLYAWFGNAISFRGYDLNQDTFRPGEQMQLMLYWMSAEPTKANYIVFVHLFSADTQQLAVGQDGPPDYGNRPTWLWEGDMQFIRDQRIVTLPADIQPGKYDLRIGMYDADTKERVQVYDLTNQPIGDGVVLQEITIEK